MKINALLKAFWQEETGLTMVEYAVAGSLITATAAAAFTALGGAIQGQIEELTGYINQ